MGKYQRPGVYVKIRESAEYLSKPPSIKMEDIVRRGEQLKKAYTSPNSYDMNARLNTMLEMGVRIVSVNECYDHASLEHQIQFTGVISREQLMRQPPGVKVSLGASKGVINQTRRARRNKRNLRL